MRTRVVAGLVFLAFLLGANVVLVAAQTPRQATVSVTAALVAEELHVRPVALHQLELMRVGDTAVAIAFRTGLDGKARRTIAPGSYRLRSAVPAQLLGKFEAHRLLALKSIRLLQCRHVEPSDAFPAGGDQFSAPIDQSVHPIDLGGLEYALRRPPKSSSRVRPACRLRARFSGVPPYP